MYNVVRFKDGTCRIFSEKTGDSKGNYEVLRHFPELEKAEGYLSQIRDFMILEDEDGKIFTILSRQRNNYPKCKIVVALTTSSNAQAVLEKMNSKKA